MHCSPAQHSMRMGTRHRQPALTHPLHSPGDCDGRDQRAGRAAGRLGAAGEACTGASLELHADLGEALDLVRGLPVALGLNALRTPEGVSRSAA